MSPEHSPEQTGHEHNSPSSSLEGSQGEGETASPENAGGRLSLAQRRMVRLQQTIGNRAVMRSVVQRAGGNTPKPANQPALAAHPAPAAPEFAEANRRYSIDFRPPGGQAISVHNIPAEEAQQLLTHIAAGIDNFIAAGREGHAYLIHVQSDMWITSTITDWVGGHVIPPYSIWESPFTSMTHARTYMERGNIRDALQAMHQAARMANNASSRLAQYREDTAQGVAQVQVYLEYTEAAGAVAATVVTGGLAEGVLATAAVAATTAGVYAAAQNAAGQGSEIHSGLRQTFDVMDMLRRGAREAIVGFVGAITGGALKAGFGRIISRFMQNPNILLTISNALGENGPRLAEFIASNLARLSTEFISFIGSTAISTAVSNVVTRLLGNAQDMAALRRVEEEGFLRQIWHALVQGGVTAALIAFLQHSMPTRSSSVRAPQIQAPELAPPGGPRALLEPPRPTALGGGANSPPVDALGATQTAMPALEGPGQVAPPLSARPAGDTGAAGPRLPGESQPALQGDLPAPGNVPVAPRSSQLPRQLSYEQAQGAMRYSRMGGQREFQPGEYSAGRVHPTADWATYVSDYQFAAGHGVTPPPHGWVGPDGSIHVYAPRGNLLAPDEAAPPLPPSLGGVSTGPTSETGTSQGGQPPEAFAPTQEVPQAPSGRAQTLSGMGGRSYTALSRPQAQAILEYVEQYNLFQRSLEQVENLTGRIERAASPRVRAPLEQQLSIANSINQHAINRIRALREQIGDPALLETAQSPHGRNNPVDAADYQNDFHRLTGNQGPAPEGGFVTGDGMIVTFIRRGR